MRATAKRLARVAIALPAIAFGLPAVDSDPLGVPIRPIPVKPVVPTFDDGSRCSGPATG